MSSKIAKMDASSRYSWEWCPQVFKTNSELTSHLVQFHVRKAERIATAELKTWKGKDGLWYGREKGFGAFDLSRSSA